VEGKLRCAFDHTAIVDALVATLKHESPFCVAAAAGILGRVAQIPGVGKAKIAASAAIPALLNVIEAMRPVGDLELAMGLFRRYVSEYASLASACVWLSPCILLTICVSACRMWNYLDP
jgi:hypothetical protein